MSETPQLFSQKENKVAKTLDIAKNSIILALRQSKGIKIEINCKGGSITLKMETSENID